MKVAINYEDGMVFQHFGETKNFAFYVVENGKVLSEEIKNTNGLSHADLIGFLKENGVQVLICGNLGGHVTELLEEDNIEIFAGNKGITRALAELYAKGKLKKLDLSDNEHNCECNCHQ